MFYWRGNDLGVVVLNTVVAEVVASAATNAPLAAPARTASSADAILLAPGADAEEDQGDEERGPGSPGEAEGVPTDIRTTAGRDELVAHLDEGRRHENSGDGVEEERDERRYTGNSSA